MKNTSNSSIRCSVKNCKYNDKQQYCTLTNIEVGSNSSVPVKSAKDTDCLSFEPDTNL